MDKLNVTLLHLALLIIGGTWAERYCDANEGDCKRYEFEGPQCSSMQRTQGLWMLIPKSYHIMTV